MYPAHDACLGFDENPRLIVALLSQPKLGLTHGPLVEVSGDFTLDEGGHLGHVLAGLGFDDEVVDPGFDLARARELLKLRGYFLEALAEVLQGLSIEQGRILGVSLRRHTALSQAEKQEAKENKPYGHDRSPHGGNLFR